MPGAPPNASTSRPESSATAAQPLKAAAWRALSMALARKLSPVSSGEGNFRSARLASSNGKSSSRARNSLSLPKLALATTSRWETRLSGAGLELGGMQQRDALRRKVQQLVELVTAKGVPLGGALNFDERAAAVHHDIHIRLGVRIFSVVQIQDRRPAVNPHGHGGHLAMQGVRADGAPLQQ